MYIAIRLEGFGLLMSLLGGIETIMETCGLAETTETVYAPNIVAHRLESKAYVRALRSYLLTETSLQQILFNKVIADEKKTTDNSLVEINQLYSNMLESTVEHFDEDSLQSEHLQHIMFLTEQRKSSLSNSTSKLWIQYLYHIGLVKDFIYMQKERSIGTFIS